MTGIITFAYVIIMGFFVSVILHAYRNGSYFVTGMNVAWSISFTAVWVIYIVKYIFNI